MSMLSPKRTKFRKSHKGHLAGNAKGGNEVSFGDYGLQVTSPGWITARQIEAARVAISRSVKKLGKIHVRVFPDHPHLDTADPVEQEAGQCDRAEAQFVRAAKAEPTLQKPGAVLVDCRGRAKRS